ALFAPLHDQRRVQALASEKGASTIAIPPLVFGQNPQLVLRAVRPTRRALSDLGLGRLSHRLRMPAGYCPCHHHRCRDPLALRLSDFESRPASPKIDTEGIEPLGKRNQATIDEFFPRLTLARPFPEDTCIHL